MKVLIDISVIPMGVGISVSQYVAECQKVFKESGLTHTMHAFGTNVDSCISHQHSFARAIWRNATRT